MVANGLICAYGNTRTRDSRTSGLTPRGAPCERTIVTVRQGMGPCVLILLALWGAGSTTAHADTKRLVVVGLRPLGADGNGDLSKLAEAQQLREAAQAALKDAVGQPVTGHAELVQVIGPRYLVQWFNCAGDLGCVGRTLARLRKAGIETAITGEYTHVGDVLKVRWFVFTIVDGKVVREVDADIPAATATDPASWRAGAARIVASSRLRIRSNVNGTACKIDKQPCVFEADRQTVAVSPGEHTVELTKDGYEPARATTTVAFGEESELSLALTAMANPSTKPPPDTPVEVQKINPTAEAGRFMLTAVRTTQAPLLDGKLDDAVWSKAWLDTNFTQQFPDEGKPPTQRTDVRVLFDDDAIYVAIRCHDTNPESIVAQLTRRDRENPSDRVTVDISSKNDKASAFHFQVNAAGVQQDGLRYNNTEYNNDWDGRWYSATSVDEKGWSAELSIPLVTLRYAGNVSSFGFQIRRYLGRRGEIDEWAYIPSTAQGEVSYYGTLDQIEGLRAKRLLEVLLYDSRFLTVRDGFGVFDGRRDGNSLGADVKLGVTPGLTLDATFNPDFGTVEVDQIILNLSNLEAYFPEKRPFFIEGADLFSTPVKLFYTRRVGATPPDPSVGSLLTPLPNGRILGAMKLTGLLAKRLSIGVVNAVTDRRDALIEREPGTSEEILVEPLTNFGVFRLRQEFGTNSSVGVTATSVNRFEPPNAATPQPGDACPVPYSTTFTTTPQALEPRQGRCTNDAYAAGLDTTLRTDDGEWGASAQVVGSLIEQGPSRLVPDGTVIGSGDTGVAILAEAGRYGGENWLFNLKYRGYSPRFQINDAGFLDQANNHLMFASLTLRTTKPTSLFQSASVEAHVEHRRDWKGRFLSIDPRLVLGVQFKNQWSMSWTAEPYYPQWYENRETQDGARTQRNHGAYSNLIFSTNPNQSLVFGFDGSFLQNIGGLLMLRGALTLSYRPIPTLELGLLANVSREAHGPRWIETSENGDGTSNYYFAELDARVADLTLRATYTFSRRLSLQAYVQPFVASGHYTSPIVATGSGVGSDLALASFVPTTFPSGSPDFESGAINLNLFVRYEYRPLSALWLVYTRAQERRGDFDPTLEAAKLRLGAFTGGPSTDTLLVKLSYLWF